MSVLYSWVVPPVFAQDGNTGQGEEQIDVASRSLLDGRSLLYVGYYSAKSFALTFSGVARLFPNLADL